MEVKGHIAAEQRLVLDQLSLSAYKPGSRDQTNVLDVGGLSQQSITGSGGGGVLLQI